MLINNDIANGKQDYNHIWELNNMKLKKHRKFNESNGYGLELKTKDGQTRTISTPELDFEGEEGNGILYHYDDNGEMFYNHDILSVKGNCRRLRGICLYNCKNLVDVNVEGAIALDRYGLARCSKLESVSLPNVKSIGEAGLSDNHKLNSLNIPNLELLEGEALAGCENLEQVSFPKLGEAQAQAFRGCESLRNLEFPSLELIGDEAFSYCVNLVSLKIPNASEIGENAFQGCDSLKTIEIMTLDEEQIRDIQGFWGLNSGVKVKCQSGEFVL